MAVLLLTVLSVGAYASNERPLVKPYYYTTQNSYSVCDIESPWTNCWWVCITTTYHVNSFNQVTMVSQVRTQGSSPCGVPNQGRSQLQYDKNHPVDERQLVREAITDQQRSLPGNEKVVLKFLN